MGYATLYGDMAGAFNPIKDLLKTQVYALARWLNRDSEVIPPRIIERPPSAELAEGQVDTDSLPEYAVLDGILERYLHQRLDADQIVQDGFDPSTVHNVITSIERNEYKRRQSAPGPKVSPVDFGKDRRMPIVKRVLYEYTNHFIK